MDQFPLVKAECLKYLINFRSVLPRTTMQAIVPLLPQVSLCKDWAVFGPMLLFYGGRWQTKPPWKWGKVNSNCTIFYIHSCWRDKNPFLSSFIKLATVSERQVPPIGLAWIGGACLSETVASLIKLLKNGFLSLQSEEKVMGLSGTIWGEQAFGEG